MARKKTLTRRQLIRSSAATAGALALTPSLAWPNASATLRVGLVGCGARGTAAAQNVVKAASGVRITALADTFGAQLEALNKTLGIPKDHCFTGLDACKQLMALDDVDLVILATPPGFRPLQFAGAVECGKHVFLEAPVAVCPAGVAKILETTAKARAKKLAVAVGHQRRHQPAYVETMKRLHDGQIGDIVSAQCYWNQSTHPSRKRLPDKPDVAWQIRNWPYFTWLSGDHIVEQHVHNIDVINWAFGALPDKADALGGRQDRKGSEHGNIYDHFGTEFSYPGDVRTISMCRQIKGTDRRIAERVAGTKGTSDCCGVIEGEKPWRYKGPSPDPDVQTFADLITSLRDGLPLSEGKQAAESALCAILARESAYSRQQLRRSWLESAPINLMPPEDLKLDGRKSVAAVRIPGTYKLNATPSKRKR